MKQVYYKIEGNMPTNSEIDDAVIKTYLEIYLNALNEQKSYKYINIIKSRIQELLQKRMYILSK